MTQRSRIFWRQLGDGSDARWWTPGWLPESCVLRSSLAASLRVEAGMVSGAAYEAGDGAVFHDAWVAETDDGDWVEVDRVGQTTDGYLYADYRTATVATLSI